MTFKVVRDGDVNSAGGRAIATQKTFYIDGKAVVRVGDPVTPHSPCPIMPSHCNAVTTEGNPMFIVEGKRVIMVGDVDSCGHKRVTGSSNFFLGK